MIMDMIFVYNADSGKINAMLDIAHKWVSPSTYQCSLCSLTHDTLHEKSEWADFKESSSDTLEFYHKDEFEKKFKVTYDYPVILDASHEMQILFTHLELRQFKTVKELISAIKKCKG